VTAAPPPPAASKPVAAGTKRSALGEVSNGGKDNVAKGGKGKDEGAKEKRALQQTSSAQIPASAAVAGPARRTRSSTGAAAVVAPVVEPAPKRRTTSRIPVAARSRSTTASTSTTVADGRLKERKLNIAIETKEVVEPEPARKKRKTSSPAPEEDTEQDDLADEGLYDEDGREVVLNSGGRATRLRSPERVTRAKDAGWTDLDAEDDGDPTMVSEYVVDAFNYMLAIEVSL
jgi:G2/mitotic-specific cyclin 1/2